MAASSLLPVKLDATLLATDIHDAWMAVTESESGSRCLRHTAFSIIAD